MINRKILKLLTVIAVLLSTCVADDVLSLSNIIEKAREQEVLTQSMLKNYIMVGMKNSYHNPQKSLDKEIAQYESNMDTLDEFAASKKAFKNIEKISKLWKPIKKLLTAEKTLENVSMLYAKLGELLKSSKETTKLYTIQTGLTLGVIIDAACNIEVYSQKMSSLYLMEAWGENSKARKRKMDEAIAAFEFSIDSLKKVKMNDDDIKSLLKKTENSFQYFKVMNELGSSSIPTLIYLKSNMILENAKELTVKYSKSIVLN